MIKRLGVLLLVLLTSFNAVASKEDYKYNVGLNQAKIDYCWYGASEACFNYDLTTITAEIKHKSNFSVRYGYGFDLGKNTQTTITNQTFTIHFSRYHELELAYTYDITDRLYLTGGMGHYWQSVPIYSADSSKLVHYDEDNDRGFFLEGNYKLNDEVSFSIFVKETSRTGSLGSCDQECIDNWEAKGSTIRSYGLGIKYHF